MAPSAGRNLACLTLPAASAVSMVIQLDTYSSKPVSGQSINLDGSVTTSAFMGSNRTQKPTCLLAEPLVSDRVAVLHKNVLRTSGRSCDEQSSRSTAREARRLRSAGRTRQRISTPAGPPQREFCLALAFSPVGETLPSYLTDEPGSRSRRCEDKVFTIRPTIRSSSS